MKNTRRPGGGRKPAKPEYSKEKNLKEQLNVAVELYKKGMSLKAIGDELLLNPIKVRKLLITAEVYKSEIAEKVKSTFDESRTKYSFILCWQFLRIIIKSVCYHFIECVCFVPLFIRIYAISGKKSTYKFLGKNDNDLWHIGMFM